MNYIDTKIKTSALVLSEVDMEEIKQLKNSSKKDMQEGALPDSLSLCKECCIAIVDDEPINIKVAQKYLEMDGYKNFVTTTEPQNALSIFRKSPPDMILLDIMMPEISGIDLLRTMRDDETLSHIPVVILTASGSAELKKEALDLGANDFLAKPIDPNELLPRVRNVLALKKYQDQLSEYANNLENIVLQRTEDLNLSRLELVQCLGRAAEFRDNETGQHVIRVGRYVNLIAQELGFSKAECELHEMAAYLHDLGKIGVSDAILLKPGRLDDKEYEEIRRHAKFGKQILEPASKKEADSLFSHSEIGSKILGGTTSPLLLLAGRIALTHHEKWDGTGYPMGLSGESIPIEGRITAVADVYDALSSKRPYKDAFPLEKCLAILREERGIHFDPQVLDAFLNRIEDVLEIQMEYSDNG
ncbi:Response regulator [hydrothermal vent metagenome]|uniref:Response regulator n=1 Tax=hydrothermal vent metagenome TaxID=652676 RepID=A0A3B1DVU6_9ZZZZ